MFREQVENEPNVKNIMCKNVSEVNMNINKSANLIIVCINAQSCANLSVFDEIKHFMSKISRQIDVVIIGETWFRQDQCDIYGINNYFALHDCRTNRKGGGLSVYVNKKWKIKDHRVGAISFCHSIEVAITNQASTESYKVIGVYRPPTQNRQQMCDFIESFERAIESTTNECCYIGGDFNIDIDRDNTCARRYLNLVESYGFKICNDFPTRLQSNTRIDHLLSNNSFEYKHSVMTTSGQFTDHEIIVTAIERELNERPQPRKRKFVDYNQMRVELQSVIRSQFPATSDVNTMYDFISSVITNSLNKATTYKSFHLRRNQNPVCPWINQHPAIQQLMREKRSLWKRFNRGGRRNLHMQEKLKRLTNMLHDAKTSAKNAYYYRRFSECTSSKQTWDEIRNVIHSKKSTNSIVTLTSDDGVVTEKTDIANIAANYFATIGDKLSGEIRTDANDHPNGMNTLKRCEASIFLHPVTQNEVTAIIQRLDNKKAHGVDDINAKTLKECVTVIAPALTHLINVCFGTGQYPNGLKIARVVAIHKSGPKDNINNYRPISILPTMNKVVERCIFNRLDTFLTKKRFFLRQQHGFRPGMSTKTATCEIVNRIQKEMDASNVATGIFMDLSKAFDCVPHKALVTKMEMAGLRGNALSLMKSYLHDRKIVVDVDGSRSAFKVVTVGVGQGTILGPLLYLIYINDIGELKLEGTLNMYADDTAIFYFGKNRALNKDAMSRDVAQIEEFYRINRLSLNLAKTQYINFEARRSAHSTKESINISNTNIEEADTVKYLGLTLDRCLSWRQHIQSVVRKVSGPVGMLAKINRFMPKKIMLMIYNSIVHSHLSYLTLLWASARQSSRRPLERLQNRALKRCLQLPNRHNTVDVYQQSTVLPIRAIAELQLSEFVWASMGQPLHQSMFRFPSTTRPRRGAPKLQIPHTRCFYGQSSLNYRGARLFNSLPNNIMNSRTRASHKAAMKSWLQTGDNTARLAK